MRLAAKGMVPGRIAEALRLAEGSVRNVVVPLGGVIRPELWQPPVGGLGLDDRVEIKIGLEAGRSFAGIAAELGFHRSTIWREVRTNGGRKLYAPMKAHRRACAHRIASLVSE